MAAGADLFGTHGFDGVRVEQVARLAGVNKAMISYHFGGKQKLYVAILDDLFAAISADVEGLGRAPEDPAERLRRFVGIVGANSRRHPGFPAMLIREVISGGKHIPDSMLPRFLAVFQAVRDIVDAGVRQGSFRPVDPFLTHFTIVGALVFFFATAPMRARMLRAGKLPPGVAPPSPEAFVAHIQELVTRGLVPDPAPSPSRR
jgi:AcrR family transcriptional regulator